MLKFFLLTAEDTEDTEEIAKRVNLMSKVLPVLDRISCPVDRPQYFDRGGFRGFLAYITDRG